MKYKIKSNQDFLKNLDRDQRNAVVNSNLHSFILAGPGSGKTTVITYKIAYLIKNGIKPSEILLLTFTKAASNEMLKRAKEVTKSDLKGIFAGTFHHLGYYLIRKYSDILKIKKNFTVIDKIDSREIIKSCRKEIVGKNAKIPNAGILQKIFSFSSNSMLSLRESCLHNFRNYINSLDEIENIYNCYIQRKSDQGLLDYDDLLSKSTFLLNYYESIRINESKRFKWILVDEFQDTNILQYSMVDFLSQVHGNLVMVGDDAQSIYSFRGVEIEKIKNLVLSKETKIFKIEFNYRSNEEIVKFINHIIPKSSIPKKLKSIRKGGNKPIVVETANRFQQALFLAQRIKEISEYTEYKNIAILYRSHYQSLEVQMELQKNSLPYNILSGLKFNETAHIKDLMAFIRISVNKFDDLAWNRILNLFGGIGKKSSDKIIKSLKENEYDLKKTRNNFSKYKKITGALDTISDFLKHSESPSSLLNYICEKFYTNYVEEKYENFKDRLSDIERFVKISEEYAESEEFLSDVLINEEGKKSGEKHNTITLTTIHQAKGLEWDVVFIISLNPGDFPSYMAIKNGNINEEERIFYVATTRAKNELYMVKQKTDFSDFDIDEYDFIDRIPENLYEKWEVEIC